MLLVLLILVNIFRDTRVYVNKFLFGLFWGALWRVDRSYHLGQNTKIKHE